MSDLWKIIATGLVGALLGGLPAYFALASHTITPDGVRLIIDREYSPSWRATLGEMQELRAEVAELQRSSAAVQGKLDILIRKYNAALAVNEAAVGADVADTDSDTRRTLFHRIAAVFHN